jgi:hypothetical protein
VRKAIRGLLGFLVGAIVLAILVWGLVEARKEAAAKAERERPIEPPSRVSIQNGEITITLDTAAQQRNGVGVLPLQSATRREEVRAAAVVLSPQELIDLRTAFVSAVALVEKAKAALQVSKREYERLSALYQQDRNASQKAVQGAEGTMRADETNLRAAQNSLHLAQSDVRQRWGAVIAEWLFSDSPEYEALISRMEVLVQVTLPGGSAPAAPSAASVETPQGKILPVRFVSPFPRLDPRIQGPSFLYIVPTDPELVPGMTLIALLPTGARIRGVVIPREAVVWWQGNAWIYVQSAVNQFVRREIPTEMPVVGGWVVTKGLVRGQEIVVSGAQQLLSEEFRSQIQILGGDTK